MTNVENKFTDDSGNTWEVTRGYSASGSGTIPDAGLILHFHCPEIGERHACPSAIEPGALTRSEFLHMLEECRRGEAADT
jgi:hypothetical protein